MTPAEGLMEICVAANVLNGSTGWKGLVGGLQEQDQIVAFLDHPGRSGEVKVAIDYPSVQAIVKGSAASGGYSAAYAKARDVYAALIGIDTPNAIYTELVSCVPKNMILGMGRDQSMRPMFSLNFHLIIVPTVQGYRDY